jgi:hypothetical protein
MAFLLLYVGGPADDTFRADYLSPAALTVPATGFAAVFSLRLLSSAAPRWRTAALDTSAYAVVLLAVSIVRAAVAADEAPVEAGFVTLIIALFTLQLPACLALSALLSKRLLADRAGSDGRPGMRPAQAG